MVLKWVTWLVFLLRQFPDASTEDALDIQPPSSVKMYSINGNTFINWTHPINTEDGLIIFEVSAKDSWEDEWINQCNQTENNSCDIVSPIFGSNKKCSRHSGIYEGRVRACAAAQNGTVTCSSWIVETIDIPMADQFSAPDFKIGGVYHGTQLRISNHPFVVRHSNISLNCYYRRHLGYKIFYWIGSNKNNSIQEAHASFEMTTISLRLAFAPRRPTDVCVQMAIINEITAIRHQWKIQCIPYTPTPDLSSQYAGVGIGIAAALLVVFIIFRLCKMFRSKFAEEKFVLPSDLNELINDVSSGQEDIERQTKTESAHMICLDLADEKYVPAEEIYPTQDSIIAMQPGSRRSLNFQTPFDFIMSERINHADSIPYIADAEAATFSPSHDGNGGEIKNNKVPYSCIKNTGRYLTAICQEEKNRNLASTPTPDVPLTIEQLARARLGSKSMRDLASQQLDAAVAEQRSRSTDNVYCSTSDIIKDSKQEPVITDTQGKRRASRIKTVASDAAHKPPTAPVCIENPTYNPTPSLSDFLDKTFYCVTVPESSTDDGEIPYARTFTKRSYSAENCASLHDRRVKSYGKGFQLHTYEDNFPSVKFFIPEESTLDGRLDRSLSNLDLSYPSASSPKRMRVSSDADSGYHVENFSVSDGYSLSPPVSPDEKLYPDVFPAGRSSHERHRCSNDSVDSLCLTLGRHNGKLNQDHSIDPLYSTNTIGLEGDDCYEDESPYVTEGSLNYVA